MACTALLSSDCVLACLLCLELIIVTIKPMPVSQAENPPLPLELGDSRSNNALRFSHVLNWSRKSLAQERTIGLAQQPQDRNQESQRESIRCSCRMRTICKDPHYTKGLSTQGRRGTLEEGYYKQLEHLSSLRQYRAAGPGFYQRNNRNSSYPDQRQTLEESLTKFIAESAKRNEENSNIIKEIQASTDAAIRNQGASIKTLEIQIGQMSKVLQERGIGGSDHTPYQTPHIIAYLLKTVSFPSRLLCYYCDDKKGGT
ncbi:hypothetical protein Tco_1050206 [Tanacetum coccineum]